MKKIKIVVTGGPSGGKTTLIEALQKDMSTKVSIVPEAASILYRGGFPRKATPIGKVHAQRAICFTQRELESLVTSESKHQVIVCDRGSLDSIAYWPGVAEDFFQSLGTTREVELARYDWVLHLDTAIGDSFDSSNPVRTESQKEALELNLMTKEAWVGHPHRVVITHEDEFLHKIMRAKKAIEMMIAGADFHAIQLELDKKI